MHKPLVSIIIPVYNSEIHLAQCIKSVLDQTWTSFEIIIVDDGSNDQSMKVANSFNHNKIKVLSQANISAGAARNRGIIEAKGDFIQFLDADDILSKNKIELQVKALIDNRGKVAVCSTAHFDNGTDHLQSIPSPYEDSFLVSNNDPLKFLINLWGGNGTGASMVQTNAWLVPKDLILKNQPWNDFHSPDDDGEYFCRILLSSNGVIYTPGCMNYYRKFVAQQNLSNRSTEKALAGCFNSILCKKNSLQPFLHDPKVKLGLANQLIGIAVLAYPAHQKLYKEVMHELVKLETTYLIPEIGGKVINKFSNLFGWTIARSLQHFYQRNLK